ncbi:MAG: GDSL-type esterase/lipase family protein [Verrucomicrobiota bacterium]
MKASHKSLVLTIIGILTAAGSAGAVDVNGEHVDPNKDFGKDASYKLVGDTTFGWLCGAQGGDFDLNGHAFVMETGGGNRTVFSGTLSGSGSFEWHGGGVPQVSPSVLNGDKPNTFKGVFTLTNGILDLDKPAGVDAIPGDLVLGTKGDALVKLVKPNQINDSSNVTLCGPGINGLLLQGNSETLASLTLGSHAVIDMGEQPSTLRIGNSSAKTWDVTKTLTVFNYKPGKDGLTFGTDEKGLSKTQLARIGFDKPAGMPAGLYTAKMSGSGQVLPDALVSAVNPPFDVTPKAVAERSRIHQVGGLAELSGKASPLKDGMTIDFFGDSITWQNTYIEAIDKAVKAGEGTHGKAVKLINRGINGGGVFSLRDGSDKAAYPGDSAQKPFAATIATDKADVVVVFIGINDVWWRNTSPEDFEKALTDLTVSAKANKSKVILATMTVHGELPDGKNSDDAKIEKYCELTRKVAQASGSTLVDLRKAYIAYLQNSNAQLRVDGTLFFKPAGVLTYDGVHPSASGTELLASLIGDGILRALSKP